MNLCLVVLFDISLSLSPLSFSQLLVLYLLCNVSYSSSFSIVLMTFIQPYFHYHHHGCIESELRLKLCILSETRHGVVSI